LSHPLGTVGRVEEHAHLLEGLDEAQRHAVTVDAAPLCVLAGAGSGKTRVVSRRIAWRVATARASGPHVLALTFTRKAAGELRERLAVLGVRDQVAAGTFHALAYAQLRRWWADRSRPAPVLLDRKGALLHRLLAGSGGPSRPPAHRLARTESRQTGPDQLSLGGPLAAEIEWAKARLIGPADYADAAAGAGRRPPLAPSAVAELYARYEAEKRRRGLVDFDDLLVLLASTMESDEELAAAQRFRFRHLFVDEFQDLNRAQWRLLLAWLGGRRDLCVVGDPNQAIYGWNGADPALLESFTRTWPDGTVVRLDANYRSTPQVLAAAAALLAQKGGGLPAKPGQRDGSAPWAVSLRAHQADGPVPDVTCYESDRAEAAGIARRLRHARPPGTSWSRLAVLTRTNAQLVLLEEALGAAGIPCRVAAGAAFLRRPEVHEALEELRRSPAWCTLDTAVRDLELAAAGLGLTEDGADRKAPGGPAGGPATEGAAALGPAATERALALSTLARLAREYQALERGGSVEGFVRWLPASLSGEQLEDEAADAVELTTFHRAKGLEWPVVFVAGLEEGLVPIAHATSREAEAEERRLLYVALTRAQTELHCSWARRRTLGHRSVARAPSPFLESIESAVRALAGQQLTGVGHLIEQERRRLLSGSGSRGRGAGLHHDRRRRRETAPALRPADQLARSAEPDLLQALRIWRARTARAAGVPPHVVLHDATLAALAASRPATIEEMIGIPGLGPVKASRYGPELLDLSARLQASA
jgi:DNA helicase-2/ATP-dependent DNA helicase PcrA